VRPDACTDPRVLAALHAQAFDEPWSEVEMAALLAGLGVCALVAHGAEGPTGFVLYRIAADEAEILTLATVPAHRRRGVAGALVRGAAEAAARAGARALFLEVAEDNAPALALYDRAGFSCVGRRVGYYARGSERADALVLRRDLNSAAARLYAGPNRSDQVDRLERLCIERGLRMTEQRRVIARVLSQAHDHPDVEELHRRAHQIDPHISIATVYRTVRLFEESGILTRHDFRQNRSRYEEAGEIHHDHLIDMKTGAVVEFVDEEIEALQKAIARRLGYRLVDHRLELYAVPADD
jgi:Fur family transcriptional regulator, ferric uptake regulator